MAGQAGKSSNSPALMPSMRAAIPAGVNERVPASGLLEVARAAPEQVAGIVLVGAKAGVRPNPALRDAAVRVLTDGGMEAAWRAYWRPLFGRDTPASVLAEAHELALDQDVDGVVRGVRAFHDRRDLTDFARAWPKPLVVISGDQDRTPTAATAARSTAAPRRRLHLVRNCGHYVNLERPHRFRALVTDALDQIRHVR